MYIWCTLSGSRQGDLCFPNILFQATGAIWVSVHQKPSAGPLMRPSDAACMHVDRFFVIFFWKSVGIQDFDKGGAHLKKMLASLRSAWFHCDYTIPTHTQTHTRTHTHTHTHIAINTRLCVLFYSNTCWNPGFRGIMHLHKKKENLRGPQAPRGPLV